MGVNFTLQELVGVSASDICTMTYSRCLVRRVQGTVSKAVSDVLKRSANRVGNISRSSRCVARIEATDRGLEISKILHQLGHTGRWIPNCGLAKH